MGIDTQSRQQRYPLPQATESMDENDTSGGDTEVATNITSRTDKTHYTVPEDGSPITISTQKGTTGKEHGVGKHGRGKSQTSLLIEYFEASKTGDKSRSRPSVRVKVTPSATKKSRSGNDSVQITSIGTDRKASYTRRIPLPSGRSVETSRAQDGTEYSHSSESNVSGRPPVEIEVLDGSDVSRPDRSSRGLMYAPIESNVSSMPPDSMIEGDTARHRGELAQDYNQNETTSNKDIAYLDAPKRGGSRSRSASRERITQKVMEKLGATSTKPRKSSRSSHDRSSKEYDYESGAYEQRRRSSKSHRSEEDALTGAASSLQSSHISPSERSYRSDRSQTSRMSNNPKLLEMVEDTIKRMILPEINALKEDQRTDRKLRSYEVVDEDGNLERRVSKSSSSPNIASKPKVVLNRDGKDPGVVLSRGDSERVKARKSSREHSDRPSSRRSSGKQSREGSHEPEERLRPKSSRSSVGLRGAAAAGLIAGGLTSTALQHHDSQENMHHRRKKRSRSHNSRSRSTSITETNDEAYPEDNIPPMPLASRLNDSEITRESIMSQDTDRPSSRASADLRTPIREVSRGSVGDAMSPTSARTPTRPSSRGLGMSISNRSIEPSTASPRSPGGGVSSKLAALAAAGFGGAAVARGLDKRHMDADGYGSTSPQRKFSGGSPVQSVFSLKKSFEDDPLVPQTNRPHNEAFRSSISRLREANHSQASLRSGESPTTQLARSAKQSHDVSLDAYGTHEKQHASFSREATGTPGAETAEEWLEREHLINESYRNSMATNRDSYQTNPYPQDEKRFTMMTDDDAEGERGLRELNGDEFNPNYVHTPLAVESAVASLMEPSTISSNVLSSNGGSAKGHGTYSDRMAEQLRARDPEPIPLYEGSTLSQTVPSHDRWAAIKAHSRNLSGSVEQSPKQSPVRDLREHRSEEKPIMTASGLPNVNDPLPEIGHFDDSKSDLTTNPSIIQGPLGGDATGISTWPYTPEPQNDGGNRDSGSIMSGHGKEGYVAAAAGGAAALAAAHKARQSRREDARYTPDLRHGADVNIDREATPTGSPAAFRDEGYVTDGRTRSAGGITPQPEGQLYAKKDLDDYHRAMDAQSMDEEDPSAADPKHLRHFSGNSHGLDSPLYDASTGKGLDRIESKDIVALMDHLTVRDAQRNARDTEILVTLVRSATEMRQSFDEMKKFIKEQDKLIMQNTDRDAEYTAQKVLGGPRPQPSSSPRTPKRLDSEEDVQTKRKGVLRRALKGLTGGKSTKDLTRIEEMLMQILDNVEDLKYQGGGTAHNRSLTAESLDSYEQMRATQDSGYEPEGQAGTSSTPSQSGHFPLTPREKQQFHSGYDGRRGSMNRVSTVLEEDDDDELQPHEAHILSHQFENNERMLTPTQETHRARGGLSPKNTPPPNAVTFNNDNTPERQRKHKSNSSSLFGVAVPKISRWSRTTASSVAPDPATLESPNQIRNHQPSSEGLRSRSSLDTYGDQYTLGDAESIRSAQNHARNQSQYAAYADTRSLGSQASKLTRTPSPLIPSEASVDHNDEYDARAASPIQEDDEVAFDDPKYQAHRNSLLLQHPQPRQGPTSRHQNTLESQAHNYGDMAGTNSDLSQRTVSDFDPATWGSSGTAGIARHRLSQAEPLSPAGLGTRGRGDEGPLVPQQKPVVPPKIKHDEPEGDLEDEGDEPEFSNSGFSKGGYYSSPYGSGHLLEPIAECYSLETESGRISPEPQAVSQVAKAVPAGRKITPAGPRQMPGQKAESSGTGTVRRKPVPGSRGSYDSLQSDTF